MRASSVLLKGSHGWPTAKSGRFPPSCDGILVVVCFAQLAPNMVSHFGAANGGAPISWQLMAEVQHGAAYHCYTQFLNGKPSSCQAATASRPEQALTADVTRLKLSTCLPNSPSNAATQQRSAKCPSKLKAAPNEKYTLGSGCSQAGAASHTTSHV